MIRRGTEGTEEIKVGDVFNFQYLDMKGQSYTDRYWCFDGRLVADMSNGSIILVDTYYGSGGNRTFTPDDARAQGTLTFVCNVNEVQEMQSYEARYYDEADVFNLSYQHGCYERFVRRKDAKRSRVAMMKYLRGEMKEAKEAVDSAVRKVEFVARNLQVVEDSADLEKVWI